MLFKLLASLAVVLATLITFSVQAPSGSPVCFVCSHTDLTGLPLQSHTQSASELFCQFKTTPNDFFCKYFLSTGLLKQDNDNGNCPPTADPVCAPAKRRRVPRSPSRPSPVPRAAKPSALRIRDGLGKKKRKE